MAEMISFMYSDAIGTSSGSKSLNGRETALNPLKLYFSSKSTTVTKRSLTWGLLKSYDRNWGKDKPLVYKSPVAGYSYLWNISTGVFTVSDGVGGIEITEGIYTIKALGVSWGVISSNQFMVEVISSTSGDIFLVASKSTAGRFSRANDVIAMINNDYLSDSMQHAIYNRLADYTALFDSVNGINTGYIDLFIEYFGSAVDRTILLPDGNGLQVDNIYPLDLVGTTTSFDSVRIFTTKQGVKFDESQYLMIALFAQNLLSASKKVIFEPWMLWATFQWYFNTVHVATNTRQIFDLSPRW